MYLGSALKLKDQNLGWWHNDYRDADNDHHERLER
jgi:hypothetical protein